MSEHVTTSDLDALGEAEVRHRLERGDYHDPVEISAVSKWLKKAEKERLFLAECERASRSSALVAEKSAKRANFLAWAALIVSIIAAQDDITCIITALLSRFTP